ncbi:MAG: hypothetical protein IJY39_09115 [Clostridia bacterium]|nr:hypothetical protein [Clostridia bacterium]
MKDQAFESFKSPEKIYHGTDFWMLNDALEPDELVRQLREMKKQGVYTFIARTYIGLKSDYPGEDFKSKLRVIVDTARELDMKLFLQAGYMPEDVSGLPREYALNYLHIYKEGTPIPANERALAVYDGFTITEWNSVIFLDMFNKDSMDFYIKQSYDEVWREFAGDFGMTILSIWVDEPSYVDTHLPYPLGIEKTFEERWGYSLIDNLHKLFFDAPGYKTVRYHYRKLLQDLMEEYYFKGIRSWCNAHNLWASGHLMLEDTLEVQISRAGATMPFYKYFDIPGIDVLRGQQNWQRGALKPPSGDYVFRDTMINTPIQCASAARQQGQEHILCEMYAVTSQDMGFRKQKYMFDYMAAHGINHRSVHGIFYSLKGRAKRMYPPHVNYYQPYWNDVHILNDYVASVSRFISLGRPEGETLVIHPLDSAFCEYTCLLDANRVTGIQPSRAELRKRDKTFLNLNTSLTLSGCIFDLGDERSIEAMGAVDGDRFALGKMSYSTVVLPELIEIQKTTLDKIKQFARQGGRVIILGNSPTMLDGIETGKDLLADIETLKVDTVSQLLPLLQTKKYSLFCCEDERSVMIRRRVDGEKAYYYVFNADCSEKKHITLTVDGHVRAERWDAFAYSREALVSRYENGKTLIDLTLAEGSNALIVTKEGESCNTVVPESARMTLVLPLKPTFRLERKAPNVLLMEYCAFKRECGEYGDEYPILAVQQMLVEENYHGKLTQRFTFIAEKPLGGLELALEDVDAHEIVMNGAPVTAKPHGYYMAKAFETVALPDAVVGENTIEITRDFIPLAKIRRKISSLFETRKGVELEAAYLIGDFAVRMTQMPERNGDLRYSRRDTVLTAEKETVSGELTKAGYPFFAGTVSLTQNFEWNSEADRVKLCVDVLDGCLCKVMVNGKDCGYMHSVPYEVDVSTAIEKGANTVTIELTNTLRNLLGPYHRPQGEIGEIRSSYDEPDIGWMGGERGGDKGWYDNRVPDTGYWTDDYLLVPLGVSGVRIEGSIT